MLGEQGREAARDVPRAGVGDVDQHPAPGFPFRRHQVQQGLLLRIHAVFGQGRHLHQRLGALRIEDRLAPGAAIGIGQQGLQVGAQQPLGPLG